MSVITGKLDGAKNYFCNEAVSRSGVRLFPGSVHALLTALLTLLCFLLSRFVYLMLARPNTLLKDPMMSQSTKQQHKSHHQVREKQPVNSLSHPSNWVPSFQLHLFHCRFYLLQVDLHIEFLFCFLLNHMLLFSGLWTDLWGKVVGSVDRIGKVLQESL